ncbi:MAG: hypothetical protein GY774_36160 [Planctomycetes bacterium]|nr:hypothetical protein [Planctomycetota bacterium]
MGQAAEIEDIEEVEEVVEEVETTDEAEEVEAEQLEPTDDIEEEVIVTIGEESQEAEPAPEWVKELRKSHRETQKENRDLKSKLDALAKTEIKPVGAKPKLEDFDYDADQFETAYINWSESKRVADAEAESIKAEEKAAADAWQETLNAHDEKKAELKVTGYDEAEERVKEILSPIQQSMLINVSKNSALLMYGLDRSPTTAKELAAITDLGKFAARIGQIEASEMKVTTRKPPPPETKVGGTAPKSGAVDTTLERLRKEASETGDFSKVSDYKRKRKT